MKGKIKIIGVLATRNNLRVKNAQRQTRSKKGYCTCLAESGTENKNR